MSPCLPTESGEGKDLGRNKAREHERRVQGDVGEGRRRLVKITGLITGIAHVSPPELLV